MYLNALPSVAYTITLYYLAVGFSLLPTSYATYAAVLFNFTCYAQVQEFCSVCYAIYIQVCMDKSRHVRDNFRKAILLECIMICIKIYTHTYNISLSTIVLNSRDR